MSDEPPSRTVRAGDFDDECMHGIATLTCDRCGPRAAQRRANDAARRSGIERTRPMHLLVKWNPERDEAGDASTLDRHRNTAKRVGSTWWGCDTDGETKSIDAKRLDQLSWQLDSGVSTHTYLFRTGTDPQHADVWRAQVLAVAQDETDVDRSHRPEGMSTTSTWLFIELSTFEQLPPGWAVQHLVRWDEPQESVLSGLRTRTSPLFVGER